MKDEKEDFGYYFPDEDGLFVSDPEKHYGKRESNAEFAAKMRKRLKEAAISVINFFEKQRDSPALGVMRYQLSKSSTSSGANYRAACRARPKNEFYAKLCIVVKETDETLFWLEMLRDSDVKVDNAAITPMGKEWQEFLMILAKAKANAKPT